MFKCVGSTMRRSRCPKIKAFNISIRCGSSSQSILFDKLQHVASVQEIKDMLHHYVLKPPSNIGLNAYSKMFEKYKNVLNVTEIHKDINSELFAFIISKCIETQHFESMTESDQQTLETLLNSHDIIQQIVTIHCASGRIELAIKFIFECYSKYKMLPTQHILNIFIKECAMKGHSNPKMIDIAQKFFLLVLDFANNENKKLSLESFSSLLLLYANIGDFKSCVALLTQMQIEEKWPNPTYHCIDQLSPESRWALIQYLMQSPKSYHYSLMLDYLAPSSKQNEQIQRRKHNLDRGRQPNSKKKREKGITVKVESLNSDAHLEITLNENNKINYLKQTICSAFSVPKKQKKQIVLYHGKTKLLGKGKNGKISCYGIQDGDVLSFSLEPGLSNVCTEKKILTPSVLYCNQRMCQKPRDISGLRSSLQNFKKSIN